jgi:ribosomal protein S18 acetylase RimI-like enzyme
MPTMPTIPLTLHRLRALEAATLAALQELIRDLYETSDYMSEDFTDKYPTTEALRADFAQLLALPGAVLLVAAEDGALLGYVVVQPRHQAKLRHTAELHMGVHSRARGRGIGRQLLEAALRTLRAQPVIERVYLLVRADNTAGIALYARCGFTPLTVLANDTKIGRRYYDGMLMRCVIQTSAD